MDSICIVGMGPSISMLNRISTNFDEIIISNLDDNNRLKYIKENIIDCFVGKSCTLMSNTKKLGFMIEDDPDFNIVKCMVNRVKPSENWKLWSEHKLKQTKGPWHHVDGLPQLVKDLPYYYKWRGPGKIDPQTKNLTPSNSVNWPDMKTKSGKKIYHLSEKIEPYCIEMADRRLETNMGLFFTTLYAILELNKKYIYYTGIDFYNNIKVVNDYNTLKFKTMGEHMKIILIDYLAVWFPEVTFEMHTTEKFKITPNNVIVRN